MASASTSQITSVIAASAQSVSKVFLIGAVGFASVLYPRTQPLMPSTSVSTIARFSFHTLTLSLIYSTTAQSISPESIGDYWFIVVAAFSSLGLSYVVATVLGYMMLPRLEEDFKALRIAATYPNIVALPILIFPSLCEHAVVYENFTINRTSSDSTSLSPIEACTADANSMIFVYFFGWSFCFFTFGLPELMRAAEAKQQSEDQTAEISLSRMDESLGTEVLQGNAERSSNARSTNKSSTFLQTVTNVIKQTFSSPGFLAMAAGIVTGCIGPLRDALFEPGAPLRFIGDAIHTMGIASSSVSTIVVAASLVPLAWMAETPERQRDSEASGEPRCLATDDSATSLPFWRRWFSSSNLTSSDESKQHQGEHARYLFWYIASRLFVTPALVILLLAFLPISVPPMALLVVIVNAALPGALIVVVLLKSQGLSSAQTVAGVYLPSYVLSVISIAAWTALGLWITLPDEESSEL
ncbi:hypothetical protein FisN_7Hh123 [Fistulifera solaris]|uniref:Uncharacterized protein n=1 Tax=Fistulifera solaris TaxID=1519565 RepID=A0A1Z5K3J2_FISSO|nr:hypothetical protein FisN_7Hh123 [Fistulifera solaris]|eukprot:GAX20810.1 hypothetical protein FisN_7Hh123 [Fistulifera solaris]